MAKLAIALCILLVACTAQSFELPDFIKSWIEGFQQKVQEQLEILEQHLKDALIEFERMREQIIENIQAAIEEWENNINNIVGTAESVKTCMKEIDFKEINQKVQSTVTKCLDKSLATIQHDYDAIKAAFAEFVNELNHAWESFTECSNHGSIVDVYRCARETYDKMHVEIEASWDELKGKVVSFGSDVADFPHQLSICGTEGKELLHEEWSAAYEQINKCVAEMDSNTA